MNELDTEREAIASMTDRLDIARLEVTPQLNGAKKRSKFAGIKLPDFSGKENKKKRTNQAG